MFLGVYRNPEVGSFWEYGGTRKQLLSVCQNPDDTAFVTFKSKSFKIKSRIRNTEENINLPMVKS